SRRKNKPLSAPVSARWYPLPSRRGRCADLTKSRYLQAYRRSGGGQTDLPRRGELSVAFHFLDRRDRSLLDGGTDQRYLQVTLNSAGLHTCQRFELIGTFGNHESRSFTSSSRQGAGLSGRRIDVHSNDDTGCNHFPRLVVMHFVPHANRLLLNLDN